MSGPWTTPPAGADLPPRNGNVQMYHTRQIYPRNDVTGNSWTPGRELVFQFESDPASGWLVPDQCKLYARFSVGTKGQIGRIGEAGAGSKARVPSQSLRFAACPIYGALSAARYSQNGVTVQAQGAELDTLAQLQLRLMGSRESHDTNGILGCDSLRQKMMHPEAAAVQVAADGAQSSALGFDPQVIPNDKHKILLERYETNKDIELATPVSLALTSFGINKFICGGSHDLRFTIGQEGRNLRKSMYTQEIPATALGSGSVVSACTVNDAAVGEDNNEATTSKLAKGAADGAFFAAEAGARAIARSRCLARYAPAIAAYDDTASADHELEIDIKEVYLMATYALPVAGTVPRPLSSQYVFDHITLLTKQLDNATQTLTQQFTIPVNTTRIILGLREGGTPSLAVNRELLGRTAGKLGHDGDGNGRITSASITLAGQVLPQPAFQIDAKAGKIIRPWSEWQGFLKSSIGNTAGAQNLSEFEDDMLLAFRIMGARDSVAQNLTTRLTFGGTGTSGNTELLVFCIGQQVWENQFDDDSSFMPTSVSVEEVV
jgi:hypothetical protein